MKRLDYKGIESLISQKSFRETKEYVKRLDYKGIESLISQKSFRETKKTPRNPF